MSARVAMTPQILAKMTRHTSTATSAVWNRLARPRISSLSASSAFASARRHISQFANVHRPSGSPRYQCRCPACSSRTGAPGVHAFHASAASSHGPVAPPAPGKGIKVTFKDAKGNHLKTVEANEGDDLLSIAHTYDIDLEGACEGSVACSTCHVILNPEHYDLLPEPEDDENDMLDMAFGLTDTSRLGCQVKLTRELDGLTATLPSATRNMFVDGKKPTHH
ncbi:hypothetical protein CERSUDRAFT_115103 [Gelatoporia subvermispora B]|uniref:2Fe-2S ferredoxin-type domain-containing protein n=1 Tax=Ceriporiopsis subvermispora (strain B) TaxID=914234 RepID=M2QYF7_CERS8|nr:hypothetical protein CERSUDRAFT_115103 [Gelatoporia subvermispora B]